MVGASCVNALASEMNLIIRCGGKEYEIDFSKGKTTKHLYKTGEKCEETGTEVRYILDKEVWGNEWYDFAHIRGRLRQLAFLNSGLTIDFYVDSHDAEGKEVKMDETMNYPGGLSDFINYFTNNKKVLAPPMITNKSVKYIVQVHPSKEVNGTVVTDYDKLIQEERTMLIEIALCYTDGYSSELKSFVNNVATEDGGDHEIGFKQGVHQAIKQYAIDHKLIKDEKDIEADDTREGMYAIVSVKLKDPNFEGQGKGKIRMVNVRTNVKSVINEALTDYLNSDNDKATPIIEKVLSAMRAREAARKARNIARGIKNISKIQNVEDLADCSCKDPEKTELFLVEGKYNCSR